jgi:assimilatory nitrate reductase catalytic subunit
VITTGRVVSQYRSGTQTRRIGGLVDQYPEPLVAIHPTLAAHLGIRAGELANVETRHGRATFKANVISAIRQDTLFIPRHWADDKSPNPLTIHARDHVSKIPEFKVCECRMRGVTDRQVNHAYEGSRSVQVI